MSKMLNSDFWDNRYVQGQTGWDLGAVSPPIKSYIDQLEKKDLQILLPGAGRGYEVKYLWENGFQNVHFLDISDVAHDEFIKNCPGFPENQMHSNDYFLHQGNYDLIIEQTFFCAIDPSLRVKYAKKSLELLNPNGKMIGLLFKRTFDSGPPFGGHEDEYRDIFSHFFKVIKMQEAYNSVPPRQGSELFFILQKIK
ncbi:MAG: TPMT family class I SAM-dependent methyltransferase [Flavobacteriales bacterium]|nr:TPMT family class I SAM-dependent methyltransferase [Flavobacteriales bacterium]